MAYKSRKKPVTEIKL